MHNVLAFLLAPSAFTASTSASLGTLCHDSPQQCLTVNTTNGLITGHPATNASKVVEYLGIPYAQPPVGELRFAPPAKYSGNGSYVASNWGYDCPQTDSPPINYPGFTPQAQRILAYFATGAGTPQSEDCLTLNIWSRPTEASKKAAKAVLVFFYGGRFSIGNTNTPFYNGQYLADAEDVVVVTLNYRLNIFGFPGAPGIPENAGLRDQRVAVEWVRDNIAIFGGDASKITIFGQSSGGVAVDYWSYAYANDPIISSLISESGNAFSFPLNPANLTLYNWYNVSGELGCGTSGDTVECMRQQPWKDIEAASAKIKSSSGGSPVRSIPGFYPSIDEEVVFSDYVSRSDSGNFAKIPYLLGNNNHEQGYYILPAYAQGINVTQAQGDLFLLESFTCANAFEAANRIAAGVPTWQFRYFGHWKNLRLYPGSGAYHGTDLEMVFGGDADVSGIPPSKHEVEVTALMQRAWAAFAADPVEGLTKVMKWPTINPNTESLVRLAYNNSPTPDFVKPSLYDAPCSTITLGALATGS